MDDNMAFVREEARKRGGPELVAKMDAALERERAITTELNAKIDAACALPAEGDERAMALVSLSEALSAAYGRVAVAYGKAKEVNDAQLMVMAIRSLVGNVQIAIDDRDATDSGMIDKIKAGWTPPAGDK